MFEPLTGLQYLKCEVACKHNKKMEKATWAERLAYMASLDFTNPKTFKDASNPIGLTAAYQAYQLALDNKPIGYQISLDACSSVLQILSLLVSCNKSFSLCGGNADHCIDAYTHIYHTMGVGESIGRKAVKNACMTALYGSSSIPFRTFEAHLGLFYETMAKELPGAWDLNLGLQELWHMFTTSDYSWILPDNFHAYIETNTTEKASFEFIGTKYVFNKKVSGRPEFYKGLAPNLIHSVDGFIVREMMRRCSYDPKVIQHVSDLLSIGAVGTNGKSAKMVQMLWFHYKKTGILSTRIFDYLYHDTMGLVDADTIASLVNSLPVKPFPMVTVHDCFRVHPNYGNDLRTQYQIIMADLNDSTLLESLCSQVVGRKIKIKKIGNLDRQTILDSNYALS